MKRKVKKMAAMATSIIMAIMIILHSIPVLAGRIIYDNETGTHGGYDYELWKDYGNTIMELNDGGTFSCQWSNIGNALFRKGRKFNSDKTYQELGDIVVEYGCDYNPNGNSYLCVYGWTRNPLVEYYIVESWGSWRPPGATPKGTITQWMAGTYEIYETTRVNQPSIDGTATFQQYWSVRTSKRTSGTISVTEHFKQWERMGMRMGKMYEVALTVEGYQSSGYANVYKNEIRIGANPTPAPSQSPIRRDAFSIIEAEEYNSTNSSTLQVIGTPNNGRGIGYIENGNTVTYSNIDFGSGATGFSATVATEVNTSIQIRSDSPTGTLLGTLYVSSTGSWNTYQPYLQTSAKLPAFMILYWYSQVQSMWTTSYLAEVHQCLHLVITQETHILSFRPRIMTAVMVPTFKSLAYQVVAALNYIENGYSTTYKNIDFGDGATSVTARVATQNATTIQVRLGSPSGTLLGTIYVGSTGSFDTYRDVSATISNTAGVKDIVLVFSGPVNVDWFVFSKSGT
nr:endo-1,4-beta-xylanase (EC 3.2.1.8) A precursor - Clostridium stercorarium [Thermoclostridium stercorarium]